MTAARFTDEFNHAATLQLAGRAGGEHAFDIAGATFTLRTEAALAPQNALAHDTLSMVVGRGHILALDKRPQMVALPENRDVPRYIQPAL